MLLCFVIVLGVLLVLVVIVVSVDDYGWVCILVIYDGVVIGNLYGGVVCLFIYVGNLYLCSLLDFECVMGWIGIYVYVDVLWIYGGQFDVFVGDVMGVNNFSVLLNLQFEEVWIEYNFVWVNVLVLVGLYDVNSEFDCMQFGGLFFNSVFGIGLEFVQIGVDGLLIFLCMVLGVWVVYKFVEGVVLCVVVFDGVLLICDGDWLCVFQCGDGCLYVVEFVLFDCFGVCLFGDVCLCIGCNVMLLMYVGKFVIGVWYYIVIFDWFVFGFNVVCQYGVIGYYVVVDGIVVCDLYDSCCSFLLFVQIGVGDLVVVCFGCYFGVGVVLVGLFVQCFQDELGLVVVVVCNGCFY